MSVWSCHFRFSKHARSGLHDRDDLKVDWWSVFSLLRGAVDGAVVQDKIQVKGRSCDGREDAHVCLCRCYQPLGRGLREAKEDRSF